MASRKHFDFYKQKNEQKLVQDLVEEAIKIHSVDAVYIPRENVKVDALFREDPLAQFKDYHHIEVYIKNVDAFEGDGNVFRKFGLDIKNQITFSVSRSRFAKVIGKELRRPREGDIIYLPMSTATALFEIRFVQDDSVFFNLGEFYVFDLQCEQMSFQDETVETGIEEIDEAANAGAQTFLLSLSAGSGDFEQNEVVYQGETVLSATGRAKFVERVDATTIKVKDLFNVFVPENGPIKGLTSNAEYTLREAIDTLEIQDDFGAKNKEFIIIDFTESNPFSEDEP